MATKHWSMIWHQAISKSFLEGKAFGWNKTVVFTIPAPVAGEQLRMRFSNRFGSTPYEIGAVKVFAGGHSAAVTFEGKTCFSIPVGSVSVSDAVVLPVKRSEKIQIRLYYTNAIMDSNLIEEDANLLPGNQTEQAKQEALHKPLWAKLFGVFNNIPAIEAVELLTEEPARAIVAFGDSITALSRWTKPLANRLAETYPGEYVLLNSGISGNCLLYESAGIFGSLFGEKGTSRFQRDVMAIPNLHTVIFGLGVNDVSYLSEKTAEEINQESFIREVSKITESLHARGTRIVMQTITPRLGARKYTQTMEALRLALNTWIREAGIFDYVFDAEAVVREEHPDGFYYGSEWHRGDHLHPNAKGGQLLADAFDLDELTGKR